MRFLEEVLTHDNDRRPFVRFEGEDLWSSYGEVFRLAEMTAGWMKSRGVERGSRVVIQLDTCQDLLLAHLACMVLGAIRVPLHYKLTREETVPIVAMVEPSLVISYNSDYFSNAPVFRQVHMVTTPVTDWAVDQEETEWLFTSGSTGKPKGVVRTMSALENCSNSLIKLWDLTPDDCLHISLPFHHAHALDIALAGIMHRGARIVISPRFHPVAPAPEANMVWAVPAMWNMLREQGGTTALEGYQRLRLAVTGSDYFDPSVARYFDRTIKLKIRNRLASTEHLVIAGHDIHETWRPDTVGAPLDWVDLQISQEDGEILIGPHEFFRGYKPSIEPSGFNSNGWFETADIGKFDDWGQIIFLGRKDDIIKRGGEKISPAEIEEVIKKVAGVEQVGCFPIPSSMYGQLVGAAIVVAPGFKPNIITDVCEREAKRCLGRPKWPTQWFVLERDQFPQTALGKIQRKKLAGICLK